SASAKIVPRVIPHLTVAAAVGERGTDDADRRVGNRADRVGAQRHGTPPRSWLSQTPSIALRSPTGIANGSLKGFSRLEFPAGCMGRRRIVRSMLRRTPWDGPSCGA